MTCQILLVYMFYVVNAPNLDFHCVFRCYMLSTWSSLSALCDDYDAMSRCLFGL